MSIHSRNMEIYSNQAKDYAKVEYWARDEDFLAKNYFKTGKILVLGCGAGRTLKPLVDLGFEVTAIDIVPEMVVEAKKKMNGYPVSILEMDAAKLDFPDSSFDTVFFPFHGIDYVTPDIYTAVAEAKRVMKKDGIFVFSSHNRWFLKKLHRFFVGTYDDYEGIRTYRTGVYDRLKIRNYFKKVAIKQRISFVPWNRCNWKDVIYRLLPFFSKSTYFICGEPKK